MSPQAVNIRLTFYKQAPDKYIGSAVFFNRKKPRNRKDCNDPPFAFRISPQTEIDSSPARAPGSAILVVLRETIWAELGHGFVCDQVRFGVLNIQEVRTENEERDNLTLQLGKLCRR
jgi:hypothetical protein